MMLEQQLEHVLGNDLRPPIPRHYLTQMLNDPHVMGIANVRF